MVSGKADSILIVGAGFIGFNTARYLVDKRQNVVLMKRHPSPIPTFLAPYIDKQVKMVLGDFLELPLLYRLIKDHNIGSIIHLAALHEKSADSLYQAVKVNVGGILEVLEAARIFGLRRVTVCSSSTVYMPVTGTPPSLQEDMDLPVRPFRYVSATKKGGEQICQLYTREYGLSIPMVRPANVWGPLYNSQRQPTQLIVENAVAGKPSDFSDTCGETRSNHIYVKDCAKAIGLVHLTPSLKHDIYNAEDGTVFNLSEFATAVKEVIPEAQIKLGKTRSAKDVDVPCMSIQRIKEDVGFTPDYDLKHAVRDYIGWLRDGKY